LLSMLMCLQQHPGRPLVFNVDVIAAGFLLPLFVGCIGCTCLSMVWKAKLALRSKLYGTCMRTVPTNIVCMQYIVVNESIIILWNIFMDYNTRI
jgi:hypothetical protein